MKYSIEHLLNEIRTINESYERLAKLSGEHFNIFNVLGMTTNEVYCHSAFITELLNPKGSHDQGSVFLNLFLKELRIEDFELDDLMVTNEKNYGEINEKHITGGRIDIIIENRKQAIVIENKIYAIDQKDQLLRYYNNLKNQWKEPLLYYLTLDGAAPNEQEVSSLKKKKIEVPEHAKDPSFENKNVVLISYEKTILSWLDACVKEATNQPLLRETINQYINLVKYLTGNTMDNEHLKQVASKMAEPANLEASFAIGKSFDDFRNLIIKEKFLPLLKGVCEELKLKDETPENQDWVNTKFSGFTLKPNNGNTGSTITIAFDEKDLDSCWIDIENPSLTKDQIQKSGILSNYQYIENEKKIYKNFLPPYSHWDKEAFENIYNGEMRKFIKDEISSILETANELMNQQ